VGAPATEEGDYFLMIWRGWGHYRCNAILSCCGQHDHPTPMVGCSRASHHRLLDGGRPPGGACRRPAA